MRFHRLKAVVCVLAAAISAHAPVGCSGSPKAVRPAVDPVGAVPADFSLEIDVRTGRGVAERAKVEERSARFVLLPDGSLHGETDLVPREGLRPARVRRLVREQMAEVWSELANAGFTDPALADFKGNTSLLEPDAGMVLVTIEIHADERRFAFVRRYKPGENDEQAVRRVVRSIAALGWASDEALAETAEIPVRYDLGADPYARYATPATSKPAGGGTP
ncbi:MAG: hypothetical protein ACO3QC_02785 [Phycisphaerales bacterium]